MPRAWHAAAAYGAFALVATWPLARALGRTVAWDLGDPVRAMWAIAWTGEQLLGALSGGLARAGALFDANIYHPAPLTLFSSDHLVAQALQALPVLAATDNPILAYNLLLLSTFVLSGLGMYLFARDLTNDARAAFVAGLLFAFAPARLAQAGDLEALSWQWMPFTLLGLHRYAASIAGARGGRVGPLAGAAAAFVALGLSSTHYLFYFTPFAAAYLAWELVRRGHWRHWRVWTYAGAAAVLALALTAPFLSAHVHLRRQFAGAPAEAALARRSADVYAYFTAARSQPVWGRVARAFPRPDGALFPGAAAILLAAAGLTRWRRGETMAVGSSAPAPAPSPHDRQRVAAGWILAAAALGHVAAAVAALLYRRIAIDLGPFDISISNITQLLLRAALLATAAIVVSPAARRHAAAAARGPGFFAASLVAALWLSLGPVPQSLGRPLDLAAAYRILQEHVPGADVLDAPARFASIATLMLAVLGGFGAAALQRGRAGRIAVGALALLAAAESLAWPFPVDRRPAPVAFHLADVRLYRPARAPAVYHAVAALPDGAVLAELPLGDRELDLRAMFYSTVHWRPLVNGAGDIAPPYYDQIAVALSDVPRHTDAALDALRAAGATHVIVHEDVYPPGTGPATTAALAARGASELFRDRGDVLLALP